MYQHSLLFKLVVIQAISHALLGKYDWLVDVNKAYRELSPL